MIRVMVISALVGLLVLVLALPATRPPEHFLTVMRAEHAATAELWGADTADAILQRALALHGDAAAMAPVLTATDAPGGLPTRATDTTPPPQSAAGNSAASAAAHRAAAREMAAVGRRLVDNAYFRSVQALMLLAAFRLAALLQCLPWLAALGIAAPIDGLTVRRIRAMALRPHDPERFAVFAGLAVFGGCLLMLAGVLPVPLSPLAAAWLVVGIAGLVGMAVGEFHRRGAA